MWRNVRGIVIKVTGKALETDAIDNERWKVRIKHIDEMIG